MKREEQKELEAVDTKLVEDSSSLLPLSYQGYAPKLVEDCDTSEAILTESVESLPALASQEQFPNLGERYEVLAWIGRGGMGVVYLVQDKISVKRE